MIEYELVVHTTCCHRNRTMSRTVYSVWTVGTALFGTFRCRDVVECVTREEDAMRLRAAPFWKVMAN